ncbi:amyloid beta precursor protein binding family B member 2-like isoform X3 [Haliotis cracherodii]|uniref:amyloid beta precursor protein binding family B member 2-like isoform X3 n=1 Tax=Haliotis cracherodii TaxID=6455 RepID=UPI0039EA715F
MSEQNKLMPHTPKPKFNFTTAETYQRRHQRQKAPKFNLSLFMYGALYRKLNQWESCWILHHNPLEDSDATYLSFANPNYHFEDRLNSNLSNNNNNNNSQDENVNSENDKNLTLTDTKVTLNRKKYANMDLSDMGIITSPVKLLSPDKTFILDKLNSPDSDENSDDETYGRRHFDETDDLLEGSEIKEDDEVTCYTNIPAKPKGFMGYYSLLEAKARERQTTQIDSPDSPDDGLDVVEDEETPLEEKPPEEKFEESTMINSPDSNDSGIQSDARSDDGVSHVSGPVHEDDLEVDKPRKDSSEEEASTEESGTSESEESSSEILPPGWEKCEDDDGAYYWHIKSGTIQRDPPSPLTPEQTTLRSISIASESSTLGTSSSIPSTPTSITSNTEEHLQEFEGHALQYAAKSLQSLCSPLERKEGLPDELTEKPIRFAVRSLGWVGIAEEDLTPERSSKAVNKCIVDLSLGRNDINDVVGRWGDGKDLFMDLDSTSLRLLDTQDFSLLNCQPIHSIRVWGVGRDNGRDFAYVARDKMSRRHMCHVFRCDTPARQIANTLRDICKKIMVERTAMQRLSRPTDLPNLEKTNQPNGQKLSFQSLYSNASFPTPMEEPKKNIRCHYLGQMEVGRATGTTDSTRRMDTLNEAIERAYRKVPPERWLFVNVAIAPSTLTISEHGRPENKIDECRVRFLSFMGIAMNNVKLCAFIMHNAQDDFYAHVFHCEPSAGPLCKTIEAACKLRYQKCLDAHPQTPKTPSQGGKNIGSTLKNGMQSVLGSIAQLTSPK